MSARRLRPVGGALALALALALGSGCGGGSATRRGPVAAPVLKAVSPQALAEFDGGLAELRRGGKNADERAGGRFEEAVRLDGSLWEAWHNLGVIRARRGEHRGAAEAFGRALKVNPAHAPALLGRAEAWRRLGDRDAAISDYESAIRQSPPGHEARIRLASLHREAGMADAAIADLRQVLRDKPRDPAVHVELGLVYLGAGRLELAELVLGRAAELDPKNPRPWNGLAMVSLKRSRDQEAFDRFDKATSLDPGYRDARYNKALVLLDAGDYKRAVAALEPLVSGNSPSASADLDAMIALGVAWRGLGEYDRAKASYTRVLDADPRNADARFDLAVLAMDFMSDPSAAREHLSRYLADAPETHARRKEAETRLADLPPPKAQTSSARKPRRRRRGRSGPWRQVVLAGLAVFLALGSGIAHAKGRKPKKAPAPAAVTPAAVTPDPAAATPAKQPKTQTLDFTALGIDGKVRTPQLLYFLQRIQDELDQSTLPKRSFVPSIERSVDREGL